MTLQESIKENRLKLNNLIKRINDDTEDDDDEFDLEEEEFDYDTD